MKTHMVFNYYMEYHIEFEIHHVKKPVDLLIYILIKVAF